MKNEELSIMYCIGKLRQLLLRVYSSTLARTSQSQ